MRLDVRNTWVVQVTTDIGRAVLTLAGCFAPFDGEGTPRWGDLGAVLGRAVRGIVSNVPDQGIRFRA